MKNILVLHKEANELSFNYLDHYTMKQNRLKVLRKNDYKCAICGKEATEIHHQDNSYSNHDPDNLLPICHKCHMQLHAQNRRSNKPKINSEAIEYFLAVRGMTKQELAQKINMTGAAVATILRRRTTKNSTLKKIAEVLGCSIEEIIIPPNGMADLKEKFEEKKVLLEAIEERINQLTDDKHLAKLYRIWLTKDLKEFFKVKSYGLISGKDMVAAIEIVRKWEPGVDISKITTQTSRTNQTETA